MPFLTSNVVRLTVGGDVSSASTVELRWSEIKEINATDSRDYYGNAIGGQFDNLVIPSADAMMEELTTETSANQNDPLNHSSTLEVAHWSTRGSADLHEERVPSTPLKQQSTNYFDRKPPPSDDLSMRPARIPAWNVSGMSLEARVGTWDPLSGNSFVQCINGTDDKYQHNTRETGVMLRWWQNAPSTDDPCSCWTMSTHGMV